MSQPSVAILSQNSFHLGRDREVNKQLIDYIALTVNYRGSRKELAFCQMTAI
jgi:hypothetical protein